MDNASKALIMAASIILGVMLLSAFVYVFRAGARLDETYEEMQTERELRLASAKFDVYDRQDNTIMDILTVINLAYDTNEDFTYDMAKAIEVVIKIGDSKFTLPRTEPTRKDRENGFGRNKIFRNGKEEPISIYDLADKTFDKLEINGLDNQVVSDKLSTTRLGKKKILNSDGTEKKDAAGNILYRNNSTIYKYIFKSECVCGEDHPTGFTYNLSTDIGRIVKIEFKAEYNPDFTKSDD